MGSTDNTATANVAKNLQSKSTTPSSSGLSAPVGIGAENRPDDVFKVSSALAANGLMTAPQSHADSRLYSSIIGAQERMDSSLKRDGLIKPGGPTEGTFSRLAGQGFVKPVEAIPTSPQPAPVPATGDAAMNAQLTAQSKQAAVAEAQARAMQTAGDVTRTGFQQMQDVNRLKKARDDAAHAEARARELEQQRRERTQRDQLQAMQKANATAADQAAKAKQTVSAGLKTLAAQAGTALGQVLQSSPQPPALPDETISSNQRLAASMARRRGIGDLPRFTTDAISTDPAKAIPEIADLLRQVHASDPAQANDLFSQTMQGIAPAHREWLHQLWPGTADRRDDRSKINDLVYRPDQDKYEHSAEPYYPDRDNPEITKMAAKADSEPHDAGEPSHVHNAEDDLATNWGINRLKVDDDNVNTGTTQAAQQVPVPDYKKNVFANKKRKEDWSNWQADVGKLPGASVSEKRAYAEIFAAEGGLKNDPTGSASSGITRSTLNDLADRSKLPASFKGQEPKYLASDERLTVYRAYMDDVMSTAGGHKALGKLDAQSASALGDTMFRHGRTGGARIIQKAINTMTSGAVAEDGAMGPQTFSAYEKLAADPVTRKRLMNALADARKDAVKNESTASAETARFDHFRDPNNF